jgi:hypothetical protein
MEHAKLANRSRHESPIRQSPSPSKQNEKGVARSARKKAAQKAGLRTVNPGRPVG